MAKARKGKKKPTTAKRKAEKKTTVRSETSAAQLIQQNLTSFVLGTIVVLLLITAVVTYVVRTSTKVMPSFSLSKLIPQPTKQAQQKQEKNGDKKQPEARKYVVQAGDDLKAISLKVYGSEDHFEHIAKANNILNLNVIEIGQELVIPNINIPTPTKVPGEVTPTAAQTSKASKDTVYVVQKGDYLYLVAEKVYGDGNMWPRIASANNLVDGDFLSVGSKLQIPR